MMVLKTFSYYFILILELFYYNKTIFFEQTCKKIDFVTESVLFKSNKELCKLNVN